jgi:hypothetical protein
MLVSRNERRGKAGPDGEQPQVRQLLTSRHIVAGEAESSQQTRTLNVTGARSNSTSHVPFYEYEKENRVSSRTFQCEQEFLTECVQKMMGQPKAHSFVKVPGKRGRFLILPWVRTPWISQRTREAGVKRLFDQRFYFHPNEFREEHHLSGDLALPEPIDPKKSLERTLPPVLDPETLDEIENFAGPEVVLKPFKARKKKS